MKNIKDKNFIIDIIMLIEFIILSFTSIILFFLARGGRDLNYFLGISRSHWISMHEIIGIIFIITVTIHMILHWKYFYFKIKKK